MTNPLRSMRVVFSLVLLLCAIVHRTTVAQTNPAPIPPTTSTAPPTLHPADNPNLQASLPETARADFESAMMLAEDGDHRGALLKFQLAFDNSGDPRLLWDLAVCEKALRHYAKALPLVQRYLKEAASMISTAERQEADALAAAISEFVGPIRIETATTGATVLIDDVVVGKTPLAKPIVVDMGDHKVTLTKRGFKDATTHVRVIGPRSERRVFVRMERDIPAATLEVVAGKGQWIWVDDSRVGQGHWEGLVRQGKHVIRVSAPGYKTKEVETDLSNGGHVSLGVVAQPLAPSEKSTRWPIVAVIGGVTLVAAVLAYYGLRPTESPASAPVNGKLDNIDIGFVVKGWP